MGFKFVFLATLLAVAISGVIGGGYWPYGPYPKHKSSSYYPTHYPNYYYPEHYYMPDYQYYEYDYPYYYPDYYHQPDYEYYWNYQYGYPNYYYNTKAYSSDLRQYVATDIPEQRYGYTGTAVVRDMAGNIRYV